MKPSENVKLLVNQFKIASPGDNTDPGNVLQSKYDINESQNMEIPNKVTGLISYKCMFPK